MECRLFTERLFVSLTRSDPSSAYYSMESISKILDDSPPPHVIDLVISNILIVSDRTNSISLLDFIKGVFIDSKFGDAVCEGFKILEKLLSASYKSKLEVYLNDIVSVCLKVLRSACIARIKETCLSSLIAIGSGPWPNIVQVIANDLMTHIRGKHEKPSVMSKEFELLGLFCHNHPEQVNTYSEEIGKTIVQVIEECVEGKAKISFPLLEGCFKGIADYLFNFEQPYELIYKGIKTFTDPKEQKRRGHARAALSIIVHHGSHFEEWLKNDRKYWHPLLLKWMNQSNRDDKKIGCQTILAYYEHVGNALSSSERNEDTSACLQFFMSYFKSVLCDKNLDTELSFSVSPYEINIALKGFATFVSSCKIYINDDEFKEIGETITQRALLLFREDTNQTVSFSKTADEESTERIEELCNHIEALAVMNYNSDANLEMLVLNLILDFPKCLQHRHYIVKRAIRRALPLLNIQIVVPYLLNESCKHFISSSLNWNAESTYIKNSLLTYEIYMPLWMFLFDVNDGENELSQNAFDQFLRTVFKLLPTLNLATKMIENPNENAEVDTNNQFTMLDSFELPEQPDDYKLFINVCDLLSGVLSLKWIHEWIVQWIHPLLILILERRRKFFNALGFLKILEIILKCVKQLEKENLIYTVEGQELTDIGKIIIELLSDISVINTDKLFELRSALVLLQTPLNLLTAELIQNATSAFKLVFSLGRTNLNLAFEALDVLEDWNSYLSKNILTQTYCELLPIFNEYLCSTGMLEFNNNKETLYDSDPSSSKQNVEKENISQLAAFQHRVMIFLGKIDSLSIKSFLTSLKKENENFNKEAKDLQYSQDKLIISIPCYEQHNLSIYLDRLLPRIKYLALHSNNRDTRITACQAIHSIILVMYGIGVSLPVSQKQLFSHVQVELYSTLLHLASDSDESISNMFLPLLKQTCHWLCVSHSNMTSECNNFILVLLKGSSQPGNSLIQDISCEVIKEFITWYIKKSSHQSLESLSPTVSYTLRMLCQMMLHPDKSQKAGAFLVILRIIPQLSLIDSAIDKYFPELLYSVAKSIELTYNDSKNVSKYVKICNAPAMKVLDKLLKVIERKSSIFFKTNNTRRKPPGFKNATIYDIAKWLLANLNKACRPLANRCFISFVNICKLIESENGKGPNEFMRRLIEKKGIDEIIRLYIKRDEFSFDAIDVKDFDRFYKNIENFYIELDIYVKVLKSRIFPLNIFSCETLNLKHTMSQFELFLQFFADQNFNNVFDSFMISNREIGKDYKSTTILKHSLENIIFKTFGKFFDFLFHLNPNIFDIEPMKFSILHALDASIFDVHKLKIFKRNVPFDKIQIFFKNLQIILENIWSIFVEFIYNKMIKIYQSFDINSCAESETSYEYLSTLSGIMVSFDDQKKNNLFGLLSKINMSIFFNSLFITRNDGNLLAKASVEISSLVRSLGHLLNFILGSDAIKPIIIINILINDKTVMNFDEKFFSKKNHVTYGEFCFEYFKDIFIDYMIKNSEKFFDELYLSFSINNKFLCLKLIEQILQYSSEKNISDVPFYQNLFMSLSKIWPFLTEHNVEFSTLAHIYSLLAMASPNPINIFGTSKNSLNIWLLNNLKDPQLGLEKKIKLVLLLPTILGPELAETWYTQSARFALDELRYHFPQSCNEFKPHSKSRALYCSAIKTLLESMANSGSFLILECLIKATAGDRYHICDEQFNHKLKSLFKRLNDDEQFYILHEVQKILAGCSDADLLFNITNRFMIPLLMNSNPAILENFFVENILFMKESLMKRSKPNMSQYSLQCLFVEWISSCKMFETLFLKVPYEKINSSSSRIAKKLNIEKQGELVKYIFTKVFNIHKVSSPSEFLQESSREFLRLSHCTAYKCLYAITIARPKEEIKQYEFLINPKGSNWESMIDTNKKYQFPLITNKIEKSKSHLIPIKKNNPNISYIASSTLSLQNSLNSLTANKSLSINNTSLENRDKFLKQTLCENMLSFDMNHALIRDSSHIASINEPDTDIVNFSMDLNDDDLNNHECMAMVCQLIKDLDRISSLDISENFSLAEPALGNCSAPWVQLIIDVLSDRSKNKNVRLFLAKVVDNQRDIFKKYSKIMMSSILSVIADRCTSFDKKINHLDICLISMLLSWSRNVLPQNPSEIEKASLVYSFVIEELNPSTQSSDIFRHCIELSKEIVTSWGRIVKIPYDIILKKLEDKPETFKCGLQIVATILVNKIPVWKTADELEAFIKSIINCLKTDDKTMYKSSAEIVGLSLDVLSHDNPEILKFCQSEFESNEFECTETVLNFIVKINKILSKWFEKNFEKFVECLYSIHKHFVFSNGSLLSKILLSMPRLPTEQKKMCLKILLDSIDVYDNDTLYKEVKVLDFDSLLTSCDLCTLTLHILNKAFNYMSVKQVAFLVKDIKVLCNVSRNKDNEIRSIVYEILIKIYNELCKESNIDNVSSIIENQPASTSHVSRKRNYNSLEKREVLSEKNYANFISQSNRREIKRILLQGLDDENKELRTRMLSYWTEHFSSKLQMHKRWVTVLQEFLGDNVGNDTRSLGQIVQIVIASCRQTPNFVHMKVFNNPLEECSFADYDWKDNKRVRKLNVKPTFVETLNSQLLTSSILSQNNQENTYSEQTLKSVNTLVSLNPKSFINDNIFSESTSGNLSLSLMDTNSRSSKHTQEKEYPESFSLSTNSSLLLTLQPQLIHRQTYKKITPDPTQTKPAIEEDFEKRLRKKFILNKNQQVIKFSGIAAERKNQKKRKLHAEKPTEAFKRFRDGDYPDIQINFDDVLSPILQLALRDEIVSKNLFIILFQSIKNHLKEYLNQNRDTATTYSNNEDNLNHFESLSIYSVLETLKGAADNGLPSQLTSTLLQICRNCLNESHAIDKFDQIINNVSKASNIQWLGTLILEEKKMIDESDFNNQSAKKAKLNAVVNEDVEFSDEIYKLKYTNQWSSLRCLYDTAMNKKDISEDLYKHYTEEYFKCFVQLSDWESFIEKIEYQYKKTDVSDESSSVISFNYDVLWDDPWVKDFILPLIFDANIHRLSLVNLIRDIPKLPKHERKNIAEQLGHFDSHIDNWSGDKDKFQYLKTNLSTKFAIWKSMLNFDVNALEIIKNSLSWVRSNWIQEYLARQNEIVLVDADNENFSNISVIQMLSEIFSIINTTNNCFNTSQYDIETTCGFFNNILKTWRNCIPVAGDDLVLWNMRLVCRSILISRLQNKLKMKINSDTENDTLDLQNIIHFMTLTLKITEQNFVNVAIKQSNVHLAEKYLNKMRQYECLDNKDEMLLGLQYTKTLKIKASSETDFENKINCLILSWESGEHNRIIFAEIEDPEIHVELLNNAAFISYEICSVLNYLPQSKMNVSTLYKSINKVITDGRIFDSPQFEKHTDLTELKSVLAKYCITYLQHSVRLVEIDDDCKSVNILKTATRSQTFNSAGFLSNQYMTMAKYCRKLKKDDNSSDNSLTINMIKYVLKAMKFGDQNARRMFPILLLELDNNSEDTTVKETFQNEIADVPVWMFIPWVSQLLAHLPKSVDVLLDLITKLAVEYPECVVHQYRSSRKMWETSNNFKNMDPVIQRLNLILIRNEIELLVKAIGGVCDPYVLFEIHLINIITAIQSGDQQRKNLAFQYMFEDLFPEESMLTDNKIRGSIFKCIKGNEFCLRDAWVSSNNEKSIPKVIEKLSNFVNICRQTKSIESNIIGIGNYSPYLSIYGDNDVNLLDVFGQYGNFNSTLFDHRNHVKISKFDSEVVIIGSLRRPIRINIIGSDGRKYSFLVKRGEDLRQDERIQQLFELMNDSLNSFDMKINTYKVIPLSWDLGLIQWLHNCLTLKEAVYFKESNRAKLMAAKSKKVKYIESKSSNVREVRYGELALNVKESENVHLEIMNSISPYYLRDALLEFSKSPEGFIHMRKNYERSLAPMNIAHWILGIGDRHMANCLLSLITGSIIGIDFERSFGMATQILSIPELIPFRLTPQLIGVLAPHGVKGKLRELMIQSLESFKENAELLLATMEVFIHEPSMNWIKFNHRKELANNDDKTKIPEKNEWSPRNKLNQCQKKLSGIIPALITIEDLRMRNDYREFVEAYCSVVTASLDEFKFDPFNEDQILNANQQVDCLISQATNIGVLSISFCELESWT